MNGLVERWVGEPAVVEELKHKPGRRLTLRARGPRRSLIVKLYRSSRAGLVADRIRALAGGPNELELPEVVAVDSGARALLLSDVPGVPLREAVLAEDAARCRRVGSALAAWHEAWAGTSPEPLREHSIELELEVLLEHAARASREIGLRLAAALPELREAWSPVTVVHRDLYEEQILIDERVGLIDLDDAALGPPELDIGNLLAHLDLLELRSGHRHDSASNALLDGYAAETRLDPSLLDRCRTLARFRLACIHDEPRLAGPAARDSRAAPVLARSTRRAP
jgi:Ser/Thr protein kinase RdoA (MazF antagonist)